MVMNSKGVDIRQDYPGTFKTPALGISSEKAGVCHVGIIITDAGITNDDYKQLVDLFLYNKKPDGTLETNQNNFLLAGHIGTSGLKI